MEACSISNRGSKSYSYMCTFRFVFPRSRKYPEIMDSISFQLWFCPKAGERLLEHCIVKEHLTKDLKLRDP